MQRGTFEKILNFLLGASGAFVLLGGYLVFRIFISFGFVTAVSVTFLYLYLALFLLLALDAFSVNKKKLQEQQKQTELLEKILKNIEEKEERDGV